MSSDTAIRAEGLGKLYRTGATEGLYRYRSLREDVLGRRRGDTEERLLWAVRDLSFEVPAGETLGIIGRNGAGKSTLFKLLAGITPPSEGRAEIIGRLGSLLEVGTGFHPELTGRENAFLSGAILGMRRAEIAGKLDEIVEFAGISRFLDTPVKRYSSGMYLRLAFAVAAHLEPDILLVDEVLAVGDAEFQRKCLGKMAEVGASGRTVLFVSHNTSAVLRLCSRVLLLDGGRLVADGPSAEVVRMYLDSGMGTSAAREWDAPQSAPGDEVARLKAVRVRRPGGDVGEEVDISQPVDIEVEYWHLADDPEARPIVSLFFYNDDGVCLFASADFNDRSWWRSRRHTGVVTATCTIPGNFLAEGKVTVSASLSSLSPTALHGMEDEAVAFQVVDRTSGEGVRGEYTSEFPGVVRPMLDWTIVPPEQR